MAPLDMQLHEPEPFARGINCRGSCRGIYSRSINSYFSIGARSGGHTIFVVNLFARRWEEWMMERVDDGKRRRIRGKV
jgi:hypothetical protein